MATRGTGKTYEEILAEENAAGKTTYDETATKTKETAAQKIANQSAVIDSAAQNTTSQYQETIDEAPKKFAGQYDSNYIDELVARKNLENSMADMGLTDSGLSRSQQTAISVMRGNADAKTRQQQQDYVTAAQQAIDQVLAQAEQDKVSYANEVNASTDDYLTQLWSTVMQNAQTNATSRYNAQLEAEAEAEKRAQDYFLDMLKAGYVQQEDGSVVAATRAASPSSPAWTDETFAEAQSVYKSGGADALDNYVYALGNQYGWGEDQANTFIASIESTTVPSWAARQYKKVGEDTEWSWWHGKIDDNDQVAYVDQNGVKKTITLKELYKNLLSEGVDKDTAKRYIAQFNTYDDKNKNYMYLK